jgi:glycerol-3-phosphate acyltransferase PlsX
VRLAIDAMGGDYAPHETVLGAVAARDRLPEDEIILVGDQTAIQAELAAAGASPDRFTIVHASQQVGMAESPVEAIRRKPDSSMRKAMELLAHKQADAVVSAGNTGALVAASQLIAKRLPGVSRTGFSVVFPTMHGPVVLIDVGASVESRPTHLLHYGLMASLYARKVLGIENPRVGVLSVGTEGDKGNELVRETRDLLAKAPLNFCGNAEGRDLFNGRFDVVVCDGFVGNIVLKCVEAFAENMFQMIKQEVKAADPAVLAAVGPIMQRLKRRHDSEAYGGAPLLGIDGLVIKCHGNSKAGAVTNALRVASTYATHHVNDLIVEAIAQAGGVEA